MAVEEQTTGGHETFFLSNRTRLGQKLTISNRKVSKLAFTLRRVGTVTGDISFSIRATEDDEVLATKVLGDASTVSTSATQYEVTFTAAVTINEEVRITADWPTATYGVSDYLKFTESSSSVKADEGWTKYQDSTWDDSLYTLWDATYKYTYQVAAIVTTQTCRDVVGTTATGRGNITTVGDTITAHGHCVAETTNPTTSSDIVVDNGAASATGTFTSAITVLTAGTGYYTRAYAINAYGTSYGANVYFIASLDRAGYIWMEGSNFRGFDANAVERKYTHFDNFDAFPQSITVGTDGTGYDVKFFGATSGVYFLWDASADRLDIVAGGRLSLSGNIPASFTVSSGHDGISSVLDFYPTLTASQEYRSGYFRANYRSTTPSNPVVTDFTGIEGVAASYTTEEAITFRGGHFRTYINADSTSTMRSALGAEMSARASYSGGTECQAENGTAFVGARIWMAPFFTSGTLTNINNFWGLWIYGEHTTQRNADAAIKINDAGGGFTYGLDLSGGTFGTADIRFANSETISGLDDTPVNAATTSAISSNWAYDHVADADPHTGYRLESADHTHQTTGMQAGQLDHGLAITSASLLDDDHPGYRQKHGIQTIGALTFADETHILTVATGITYWFNGVEKVISGSTTCDIDDYETLTDNTIYWFYFEDTSGTLKCSDDLPNFKTNAYVAAVFWNASNGAISREHHSYIRNPIWHEWAHYTVGLRYESGLTLTLPTTDVDNELQIENGIIWDEDLESVVSQQTNSCRIVYKASASIYTWVASSLPYAGSGVQPQYLDTDNYTLTNVGASDFVCMWVYATNDIDRPIYIIPTHAATAHNVIALARAEVQPILAALNLSPEVKLIYRFIYKGNGEFQESNDYRLTQALPSGGVATVNAGSVAFIPSGDIAATTVQTAIEELDTEKQPLDTTLTSIAALGTAADKIAYTTNTDVWAEAAITAAGRSMIAGANAAAQLALMTTALKAELDLLDLAGLTAGDLLMATAATTAAWSSIANTLATISPLTTRGDIMFRNATVSTRLAKGTAGYPLVMGADDPQWGGAQVWNGAVNAGSQAVTNIDINSGTLAGVTVDGDLTWSSAQTGVTLTSPAINGTISTTGLTMPAITLAGTVTGGNQAITGLSSLAFGAAATAQQINLVATNYIWWEAGSNAASRGWGFTTDVTAYADFAIRTEATKGGGLALTRIYVNGSGIVTFGGGLGATTLQGALNANSQDINNVAVPGAAGDPLIKGTRVTTAELPAMTDEYYWVGTGANVEERAVPTSRTIATGNYTGNGADNRQITTGFKCSCVMVAIAANPRRWIAIPNSSVVDTAATDNTAATDCVLHATDGFEVDNLNANIDQSTYYYWAISE